MRTVSENTPGQRDSVTVRALQTTIHIHPSAEALPACRERGILEQTPIGEHGQSVRAGRSHLTLDTLNPSSLCR